MNPEFSYPLLALEQGAHGCLFYEAEPSEQLPAIVALVQETLREAERFVYITNSRVIDQLEAGLVAAGTDVREEVSRGSLKLLNLLDEQPSGSVETAEKVQGFCAEVEQARAQGFAGVRFVVDMTALLGPKISVRQLDDWQAAIKGICGPGFQGRIVCQFKRSQLSPTSLKTVRSLGMAEPSINARRSSENSVHSPLPPPAGVTTRSATDRQKRSVHAKKVTAEFGSESVEVAENKPSEEPSFLPRSASSSEPLSDLQRLHALSTKITEARELGGVLEDFLAATLSLYETQAGVIFLADQSSGQLTVRASAGLGEGFLGTIEALPPANGVSVICFQQQKRVAVVDLEQDTRFPEDCKAMRNAGFRGVQSTPLLTHDGKIHGVITVYFSGPRRMVERELSVMDLFAKLVADFIDRDQLRAHLEAESLQRRKTEEALNKSEQRLRMTYACAPVGFAETDVEGRFVAANERFCDLTGYSEAELLGQFFTSITHPEDIAVGVKNFQRLWAGDLAFFEVEKRYLHKTGRVIWTNLIATLVTDDTGNATVATAAVQDITDRKLTEQRLVDGETRFEAILDNSPSVIYLKDLQGKYLLINREHEKMFEKGRQEVVGKTCFDLHPKEIAERLTENDRKVIANGSAVEFEETIQMRGGTRTYLSVKFPLRTTEGRLYGIAGISTDISERKRAERNLELRARTLEILNRVSSALVAELDLGKIVQIVTDAGREVSGAQFGAFFYNVKNGRGESYTLHSLSGAPRSAFANLPMARSSASFDSTFSGEGVVRLGDVSLNPQYAASEPLHGILKGGLPVRSYLAAPVLSRTGEVLGRLVFWHSSPDVFTGESETLLDTLSAQAAISLDMAKLYAASQHELASQRRAEEAYRRLAAIVESSDDAIISKGLDGVISSWNKGAQRIFGYTESEAVGKPVTMLIPKERQDEEPNILKRIMAGERIEHYDTIRQHKNGSLLQISLSVSSIKNADGVIIGASKIARDVTERKRLEQQQKALYDLVAHVNRAEAIPEICDAAVDAICRCHQVQRASILLYDVDGVMRFKAWRNLSDRYREAVSGHSPWVPDEPDPQTICIDDVSEVALDPSVRSAVESEGIRALAFIPLTYERRLLGKFMIYYDSPHRFGPEELRPAQAIASQVSFAIERQKSEQALEMLVNQRTASLREAIAQMEEFSYSVSHDLRSPVRAMQGYAKALMEDYGERLDAEGRDFLARIIRGSTRMDRLIQDVLTYSRLSRREIHPQTVSLDKLVREIVQQYPEMQAPHARITVDGSLHNVIGHEPLLSQVVSNLLGNAVKFVARGQPAVVRLHTELRENSVRFWVEDNGIGIRPEYHPRLFGMFERVHPEKKYEGTGIGLAIVRKAVERMGGKVGVESDGTKGSKFWVQLPAA